MPLLFYVLCTSLVLLLNSIAESATNVPLATVRNGTLEGSRHPTFEQDLFLGVSFCQPPLGELRFRHPAVLNTSWPGIRKATRRSSSCPGYGGFSAGLTLGEDCLTLDIVRPSGANSTSRLPVYVWIYGGGYTGGGSADSRYNTSYIVKASMDIGKPIIAVSLNYRLAGWGFLSSEEIQADGASNIGLFDQRLALRWISENIHAFGGDPEQVTIAGESAGAFSVGYHLVGFGGDHGGLFRGAILQSGSALGPTLNTFARVAEAYQPIYENVTETVGCTTQVDSLDCLRKVPYGRLFAALAPFQLTPIVDGEFLQQLPSKSFKEGKVVNVAILAGSNTDEGTATFLGPRNMLHNDTDTYNFLATMRKGLDDRTVQQIMELYPDDPAQGCPFNTGSERFAENGLQYKRGAAIAGDLSIHAGRRATVEFFASLPARKRKPVYSYRFDQTPWNNQEPLIAVAAPVFATHYAEICFVFNIAPDASKSNTNWIGPYPAYYEMSNLMSRMFISFIHDLNPNNHGIRKVPQWRDYRYGETNFVFNNLGCYVERDNWRERQLAFWSQIWDKVLT